MFGIQWDLVLKYINTKGTDNVDIKNDSRSWGNYYLEEFSLNQTIAHGYKGTLSIPDFKIVWEQIPSGYKHNGGNQDFIALSTGASKRNMKKNIYDLAGNMNEFTLECGPRYPCIFRSGDFSNRGRVSDRWDSVKDYASFHTGFRVSLY